jgi:glycosyltransferase involved in cell wall biosynthesis
MKFTVVTACRNAAAYIDETVKSVLSQPVFATGRCELEYLVCDGASTDGTLELVRRYEGRGVRVSSEPDGGFYDALAKGLQRATGDYVAYLNAGDLFHPAGPFRRRRLLRDSGRRLAYRLRGGLQRALAGHAQRAALRYRRALFECGAYDARRLPALQQESTLWRRSLHATVDFKFLAKLRYAGDAYLWKCFATAAEPAVVRGQIGGFRIHRGQISESLDDYVRELRSFSHSPNLMERLRFVSDRFLWAMPERIRTVSGGSLIVLRPRRTGMAAGPVPQRLPVPLIGELGPGVAGEDEVHLPERIVVRPVQRVGEVDAAEAALAEPGAHLGKRQALRRDAEVVALHDDHFGVLQCVGRALENRQLEAVRVELEKVRAGQLPGGELGIQGHDRHFDTADRRRGSGLPAERIVARLEVHLAGALPRRGEDVLSVGAAGAVVAQRGLVNLLRLDEQVLAIGKVRHQLVRPAAIRGADVDHGAESVLAGGQRAERTRHRAAVAGGADARQMDTESAQRALDRAFDHRKYFRNTRSR